jgi:iron complex outermembrane receptor protein
VGWIVAGLALAEAALAANGSIAGRITDAAGSPLAGVTATIAALGRSAETGADGEYRLADLPPGTHEVLFFLGDSSATATVEVPDGGEARLDRAFDWSLSYAETITVVSASRRAERITEAPAAVTVVAAAEIERQSAHGQLPKLLEFTPGAQVTQSGVYDFNFNTRGFNSSLNRRVAVLIDGREPSVPFLGSQEWAAVSFPLDDIAQAELVRGPSAALYGSNAASGVLNVITKRPEGSEGGLVRVAAGELSTLNADLRWAGRLGGNWWGKLVGGVRQSGDFTVSRNGKAEYSVPCTVSGQTDCLPQERVPLTIEDDDDIQFGSLRIDRAWADQSLTTIEGGWADVSGPVFQTGIGRVQVVDAERRWLRLDHSMTHWNFLATYNRRDGDRQTALSTGTNIVLGDQNWKGEIQGWLGFADDRGRIVGGASYEDEKSTSRDPSGPKRPTLINPANQQTLLFESVIGEFAALYSQLDWNFSDRLKAVVAARYDDSNLHDPQFSPKGALVWQPSPNHALRLTYNQAFQVPNYSEFFLQADVGAPINLAPFEAFCFQFGVKCGFDIDNNPATADTRILALGNSQLEVEEVTTYEVGYTGILGGRSLLTLDVYRNENENFITDLLPQLNTALGRINPQFGPYQTPRCRGVDGIVTSCLPPGADATLVALLKAALGARYVLLSNNVDATPILAAASYANFGAVDTTGVDFGLNWQLADGWTLSANYSWFDFEIQESRAGLDRLLLPNAPENSASLQLAYVGSRFDCALSGRWSDDFRWAVGPFQGDVPSYQVVDLTANLRVGSHVTLGVNVANLLDEEHWEAFGGDLLARRALGSVTFAW